MDNTNTKTFIGEDIEIVGSIKCASNIHMEGKLNGDLTSQGDAVIGVNSVIKGNCNVNSITVLGQINGNIVAKDKIDLKSTAKIMGDVRAKRMSMEDGVSFVGKAEVNPTSVPVSSGKNDSVHIEEEEQQEEKKGIFGRK